MMNRFWMINVVWYDGTDAYVSKFVGKVEDIDGTPKATEETEGLIGQYLNGNGEVVKFDPLYPVDLDNIVALKDAENGELSAAYGRFKELYF